VAIAGIEAEKGRSVLDVHDTREWLGADVCNVCAGGYLGHACLAAVDALAEHCLAAGEVTGVGWDLFLGVRQDHGCRIHANVGGTFERKTKFTAGATEGEHFFENMGGLGKLRGESAVAERTWFVDGRAESAPAALEEACASAPASAASVIEEG
jgi:hypothetical protein